jgi:hypothetical protein
VKRGTARTAHNRTGGSRQRRTTSKRIKVPRNTAKSRTTRLRRVREAAGFEVQEIESLRGELARLAKGTPPRWNADPEDVRRSVAKLVLTLVEFIRQLLERQAIRRMDAGTLTPEETEAVGLALMRLEETIRDIGAQFGLTVDDLNLDLGPVGKLM